ncbi:cell division protein FtsQ/DivIB [Fodinicola acaciae]|uniref:cell division protein FtsQ/DivIB n=1 Tax=Fodinicola acaciae TaxID=2681555 RepID=UPI0013D582B2|nr:FtsQ-type POTRA domain-containing protein [Fodinicola acaciae]
MKVSGTPRRDSWRVVREEDQTRRTDDLEPIANRLRGPLVGRWHRLAIWSTAVVLALVVGVGAWLVYGTNVFDVRTVSVTGAKTVDPAAVVSSSGISRGSALAHVDSSAVRSRLLTALPALSTVSVTLSWPHTVSIEVGERVAVAVVGPGYREIDSTGVVFRTVPSRPAGLPLLSLKNPGPRDPATLAALTVSASLTPSLRGQLVQISAPTPAAVTLQLTGDRTVLWGDASQSAQKAAVLAVLLKQKGKKYDVSAPSVVTVR